MCRTLPLFYVKNLTLAPYEIVAPYTIIIVCCKSPCSRLYYSLSPSYWVDVRSPELEVLGTCEFRLIPIARSWNDKIYRNAGSAASILGDKRVIPSTLKNGAFSKASQ